GAGFAVGASARDTVEVGVPLIDDPGDPGRSDAQYIAWFEVAYPRRLQASLDTLFFAAPDSVPAGRFQYAVSAVGDSASSRFYDRTDPDRPVLLVGGAWSGVPGSFTLTVEDSAGAGYRPRYALLSTSRAIRPSGIALYAPPSGPRTIGDLLDPANQADYVVVAPPAFHAAAESLAADRSRFLSGVASPLAAVVTTDRIYAQFAGGTPDVAAIRNFLAHAYRHWARPPLYVCLLGDASLDPLNYSGLRVLDFVPTYSGGYHTALQQQFSTDDWLVRLDGPGDQLLDLAIGRLPARTPEEALLLVSGKRRIFEGNVSFDLARNRALLCADDAWKWSYAQQLDPVGLDHVRQMERKDRLHLPFAVTRAKVYVNDYAFSDSLKTSKPGAREAFIAEVNRQAWLVDYIGHGSDNLIADEQVFRSADVSRLTNVTLPGIWCFMSCTVGKFDDFRRDGMAELLVRAPEAGAVAALAATGEVFGIESSALNDRFVDELFPISPRVDSLRTVGLAWARAKNQSVNFSIRKYNLIGEPGLLPPLPRGRGLWEKAPLDSVLRGEQVTLRGHALLADGSPDTLAAGTARLRILGPPSRRIQTGSNGGNPGIAPYELPGPLLYQGDAPLTKGAFQIRFTVPVDARVSGAGARLEALLEEAGGLGVGLAVDSLRVATGLSPRIDVTPPAISLVSPPDTTFAPGDRISIALEDSSGIDLTGFDNAHAIFVLFDDAGSPINLTSGFRYEPGSSTRGTVELVLPSLANGPHRLEVHGSDTYRNIGSASFVIEIAAAATAGGALNLSQVFNYPNPFERETYVHVRLSQPARLRVQILTVAGRRVREWSVEGKAGENYLPWDGRDSEGENVAIGVYLIHVTAEAAGKGRVDAVGRALRTR
ncbi:MAG: C25 family cysteine peptidase, partial [Candidatus Eisenbacteria bacterium]